MRDYESMRRGMLSHNKLLFGRGLRKNGKPFAWVYVGSANISESAWGGQKVLKSGQIGSLNIRYATLTDGIWVRHILTLHKTIIGIGNVVSSCLYQKQSSRASSRMRYHL
jgi:hypothetical protein